MLRFKVRFRFHYTGLRSYKIRFFSFISWVLETAALHKGCERNTYVGIDYGNDNNLMFANETSASIPAGIESTSTLESNLALTRPQRQSYVDYCVQKK